MLKYAVRDSITDVSIHNPEGKKLENKDADNYEYQDKIFTSDQMAVINRGVDAKLNAEQMELFANPEFTSAQMEEIRFSIMDGLSMGQIRQYATKEMAPWQMVLFRIGLQHGVTYNDICKITPWERISLGSRKEIYCRDV